MNDLMLTLAKLGVGALLAWAALPVLLFAARRARSPMPDAREKTLLLALAAAAALLAVPFLPPRQVPKAVAQAAGPLIGTAGYSRSVAQPQLPVFAAVGGLFALLVAARAALRTGQWIWLQRKLRHGEAVPERVAALRDSLCRDLGIAPPAIVVSRAAALPFVTGVLSQRVVLPLELATELRDEELALVLRHELIHVARKDGVNALLAELCALPFAFHPSTQRALAEIIVARESAVDLRASAPDPHGYATLLVQVAERHQYGPAVASAVAMGKHALGTRLASLMQKAPRGRDGVSRLLLLAAAVVLSFAVMFVPRVTLAATTLSDGSVIPLAVNQQLVIDMGPVSRIAIGDPSIADVRTGQGMELHLTGRGEGKTTLMVWQRDGTRTSYLISVK